jgi:hypothetical protein
MNENTNRAAGQRTNGYTAECVSSATKADIDVINGVAQDTLGLTTTTGSQKKSVSSNSLDETCPRYSAGCSVDTRTCAKRHRYTVLTGSEIRRK